MISELDLLGPALTSSQIQPEGRRQALMRLLPPDHTVEYTGNAYSTAYSCAHAYQTCRAGICAATIGSDVGLGAEACVGGLCVSQEAPSCIDPVFPLHMATCSHTHAQNDEFVRAAHDRPHAVSTEGPRMPN